MTVDEEIRMMGGVSVLGGMTPGNGAMIAMSLLRGAGYDQAFTVQHRNTGEILATRLYVRRNDAEDFAAGFGSDAEVCVVELSQTAPPAPASREPKYD